MKVIIFQDFKSVWHWELITTTGATIDGNNEPLKNKFKTISTARNIVAGHGIFNPRIVELTERKNKNY